MNTQNLASPSRRTFLIATTALGGGLLLGFGFPARGQVRDTLTTNAPFAPNGFLRIDRAGKVTFVVPVIEMGQGTYTSIPMLIAEELEVDVDKVAIEQSPPDDELYVNPLIGYRLTGASTAIRGTYVPLRQAGATARVMLVTAAAQRRDVDPSSCRVETGVVVHAPTGRRLPYGKLVDAAPKLPVPQKVALKEPRDFKLIGTPHRRLESAGKVDGSAQFGIDVRLPGMKFAVVAASPTFGGKLVSVDETKAMAVRGVSQVVRLDDAVAIVATNTWVAMVEFAPAHVDAAHRHPGHAFVYVLEGAVEMQMEGGALQTLKPGDTFYENPNHTHTVGRNVSRTAPAKLLVLFVTEQGVPLVLPPAPH